MSARPRPMDFSKPKKAQKPPRLANSRSTNDIKFGSVHTNTNS